MNDLTGLRFGKLLVIEQAGRKNGGILWSCKCDCGNPKDVQATYLTQGKTRSCGCLRGKRRPQEIMYKGETKRVGMWAKQFGLPTKLILDRINNQGWSVEKALQTRNCKRVVDSSVYTDTTALIAVEWLERKDKVTGEPFMSIDEVAYDMNRPIAEFTEWIEKIKKNGVYDKTIRKLAAQKEETCKHYGQIYYAKKML